MVRFESSETFREIVWVSIEELHPDGWHIGGRPFQGPKSLHERCRNRAMSSRRSTGHPTTRAEWAQQSPVREPA
jgi:4-oxalocrotonate tautomerase